MKELDSKQLLALSAVLIGAGGLALGLQRDASGALVGTGYAALAVGALVAVLIAFLPIAKRATSSMPRDVDSLAAAAAGFVGMTFLVSGVLVPGGPWMFVEGLVLVAVLARSGGRGALFGLGTGGLVLLIVLLFFRLWVTYQGVRHHWTAIELNIPLLSGIELLPDGMRFIKLGEFTAEEFGLPAIGLHFPLTAALWSLGFALCAVGLWLRQGSAAEFECDRIHATIQELPPELAALVERLLPEDEWEALGLFGLPERRRKKRISALTKERVHRLGELEAARETLRRAAPTLEPGFAAEVGGALERRESYDREP